MDVITEQKSRVIKVTCYDENEELIIPEKGYYSLYDGTNGVYLIPETEITPAGSVIDFDITTEQNSIKNPANTEELRVFTFKWSYNAGLSGDAVQYQYMIKKLE